LTLIVQKQYRSRKMVFYR